MPDSSSAKASTRRSRAAEAAADPAEQDTQKAAEDTAVTEGTSKAAAPASDEPRFGVARVLDPSEGPRIVGEVEALGRRATHPEIVGALVGYDREDIAPSEVHELITNFLSREV